MRRTSVPRKIVRPAVSREAYTLKGIERAWPSGAWVDETPELEEGDHPHAQEAQAPMRPPSITIIGGTKYDAVELERYLGELPPDTEIITGVGRGVEQVLSCHHRVELEPDLFANPRKVNVEQVLSYHLKSPLLLVGEGERVKQAKAWLKRANWGREVIHLP